MASSLPLALGIVARLTNQPDFAGKNAVETAAGHVLVGPANLLRYLSKTNPHVYGNGCVVAEVEADTWLEWTGSSSSAGSSIDVLATLNAALKQRTFLGNGQLGMADALAYAYLHVNGLKPTQAQSGVKRWLRTVDAHSAVQDAVKAHKAASTASSRKGGAAANAGAGGGKKGGNCPPLEGNVKDVVTRFPPEPSGHLHIGHCKALFLNQYYAQGGTLLLRFDDTNPSNEKDEYCDAIMNDLKSLGVVPARISHTSDHFDLLLEKAKEMIRKGLAFCDWSTQEEMKKQRDPFKPEGLTASPCRDLSVEDNLALFEDMIQGKPWGGNPVKDAAARYCTLRAKITDSHGTPGYLCGNGSMRDPALYRVILDAVHLRTGKKYKLYPTYDFACPIIDSHEGVTHVLRDNQYSDRIEQFEWIQASLGLRTCYIQQFSRVNFVRTLMSKRKLALLIQEGYASGWDDPRFPTVKGMIRRGMLVESVRQFMLELGGSVKNVNMEWDKIWSDNMRALDPIAARYMAVNSETSARVVISDFEDAGGEVQCVTIPLIPKDPSKGSKTVIVNKTLLVEWVDIQNLKPGHVLGLMRFCVVRVDSVDLDKREVRVTRVEGGGDFRKCDSLITWVADHPLEQRVLIWEYDFLLKEGAEDDDSTQGDWKKTINLQSAASTVLVANNGVRNLQHGDFVQFERRGFFRVDKPFAREDVMMELIQVPDGKKATMSVIGGKLGHQ